MSERITLYTRVNVETTSLYFHTNNCLSTSLQNSRILREGDFICKQSYHSVPIVTIQKTNMNWDKTLVYKAIAVANILQPRWATLFYLLNGQSCSKFIFVLFRCKPVDRSVPNCELLSLAIF